MKDHFLCKIQVGLGEEEGEETVAISTKEKGSLFKPKVSVGAGKQMSHGRTNVEWTNRSLAMRITGE